MPVPVCYPAEFDRSIRQTVPALLRRRTWKKWFLASRLSRSVKVMGTDTDRSATYDFLWTFHNNNYEPISYRFLVRRQFQSNIAIFFPPRLKGFPVKLANYARIQKSTMMGLPSGEKTFDEIFSHLDVIHERDRRTDWQTDGHRPTDALTHSVAR